MQNKSIDLENVDLPLNIGYFRSRIVADKKDFVKYLLEIKERAKTKDSTKMKILKLLVSILFLILGIASLVTSIIIPIFLISNSEVRSLLELELGWSSPFALFISLGLFSMGVFFLTFVFIFLRPRSYWSPQLEETLRLMHRLKQADILDKYIESPTDNKPFFRLKNVSIYWDLEWSYPFLFQHYLPLLGPLSLSAQTLLIFALVPGLISLIFFSLLEFLTAQEFSDTLLFSFMGLIIISFLAKNLIRGILQGYYPLKKRMIIKQKEKLHALLLEQNLDSNFILVNQNNLNRLYSMPNIPLPILVQAYSLFLVIYPAIAIT
ncbi:MAG: hypothetical protein ACFFCZ_23590, partial [Promethearchaeota archaeon]